MKLVTIKRLAVIAALASIATASATAQIRIDRSVVSGGAVNASGSDIRVSGTIGQAIAGYTSNRSNAATLGFWMPSKRPTLSSVHAERSNDVRASMTPNVASTRTMLSLSLERATSIRIAVVDMLGRVALRLDDEVVAAGSHNVEVDVTSLAPGRYTTVIESDDVRQSVGFVVVR